MSDLWYTLAAYAIGLGLLLGYAASLFTSRRAIARAKHARAAQSPRR